MTDILREDTQAKHPAQILEGWRSGDSGKKTKNSKVRITFPPWLEAATTSAGESAENVGDSLVIVDDGNADTCMTVPLPQSRYWELKDSLTNSLPATDQPWRFEQEPSRTRAYEAKP